MAWLLARNTARKYTLTVPSKGMRYMQITSQNGEEKKDLTNQAGTQFSLGASPLLSAEEEARLVEELKNSKGTWQQSLSELSKDERKV